MLSEYPAKRLVDVYDIFGIELKRLPKESSRQDVLIHSRSCYHSYTIY